MNDPRADLTEMRTLITELLQEERDLTSRIGAAIASGELPVALRERRASVRVAIEDAYASMPHLEARVRDLVTVGSAS